jgi:hypothetical protein
MDVQDRTDYGRAPIPHSFVESVREHLNEKPIDQKVPGDLLLIAPGTRLQHACIYTDQNTIIHSTQCIGVEERQLGDWESKIRYCFDMANPK